MKISLEEIKKVANQGPFYPDWDSLATYQVPNWFKGAKFGIFVHWGLYSIPAFGSEWYSRNMYIQGTAEFEHHVKTYGSHKDFGYKDFIPLFTAEKFQAEEWVQVFKEAGARYIFPVAEHHDGFQLYESQLSPFNSVEMGPKRDILQELKQATDQAHLHFCTSSHRAEHHFFFSHGKEFDSDIAKEVSRDELYWPAMPEPDHHDLFGQPYPDQEFLDDWLLRTCELVRDYQPEILYFDWWIQHIAFKEHLKLFAAYYYNLGVATGKPASICYKHDALAFGSGIVEMERGGFAEIQPFTWQTDTAIARNSWGYTEQLDYKSAKEIIQTLIDVVSKNGNLLLNIGPKGDGSIPERDQAILKEIGTWLEVNGPAIYDSYAWRQFGEGPTQPASGPFSDDDTVTYTHQDFRFTAKGGSVYVFAMEPVMDQWLTVEALADERENPSSRFHGIIKSVSLLDYEKALKWEQTSQGLRIFLSEVETNLPLVFKVELA